MLNPHQNSKLQSASLNGNPAAVRHFSKQLNIEISANNGSPDVLVDVVTSHHHFHIERRHFQSNIGMIFLTSVDVRMSNGHGPCGCLACACANLFRACIRNLKYENLFWGQLYEYLHRCKFPAIRYAKNRYYDVVLLIVIRPCQFNSLLNGPD